MDYNGFESWLKKQNLSPPFWVSEEYFKAAGWEIKKGSNSTYNIWEDSILIFPTWGDTQEETKHKTTTKIWCGIGDIPDGYDTSFLDYEFIYDPKKFIDLSGKKWRLFRKNMNRFYSINTPKIHYKKISNKETYNILIKWLQTKREDIEDGDIILDYLQLATNIKGLYFDHLLIGFNVWDENWKYINFRYSFYDPDIPFCNYVLRYYFYKDPVILQKNKKVNDGGSLGKKGLEFFKDHLNPVEKNKRYSWIPIPGYQ